MSGGRRYRHASAGVIHRGYKCINKAPRSPSTGSRMMPALMSSSSRVSSPTLLPSPCPFKYAPSAAERTTGQQSSFRITSISSGRKLGIELPRSKAASSARATTCLASPLASVSACRKIGSTSGVAKSPQRASKSCLDSSFCGSLAACCSRACTNRCFSSGANARTSPYRTAPMGSRSTSAKRPIWVCAANQAHSPRKPLTTPPSAPVSNAMMRPTGKPSWINLARYLPDRYSAI